MPMIFLFTTCTLCFLFILWRRADALRSVIAHRCAAIILYCFWIIYPFSYDRLKTITHPRAEGAIRLSEDDGPPAREFLEDDYDDDNEGVDMNDQIDAPSADLPRETGSGVFPSPRISNPSVVPRREGVSS
jgi:hypothetical protein